jgi:hypothetical protein
MIQTSPQGYALDGIEWLSNGLRRYSAWQESGFNPPVSSQKPSRVEAEIVSTEEIIAAFVVSVVGFSLFLFGKKQQRLPQFIAGILMMASPLVMHDPVAVSITAIALLIGMRIAIRYES